MQIYRNFEFGKLLKLIMLDTRVIGRDQQNYTARAVSLAFALCCLAALGRKWHASAVCSTHLPVGALCQGLVPCNMRMALLVLYLSPAGLGVCSHPVLTLCPN